jgi:hypothetical protein
MDGLGAGIQGRYVVITPAPIVDQSRGFVKKVTGLGFNDYLPDTLSMSFTSYTEMHRDDTEIHREIS